MIYTDSQGRPFPKPEPSDYPDTATFLHAYWAWKDAIASEANRAFTAQFTRSLKKTR